MSHHYSGPEFGFPRGDARLDLTDLYAFLECLSQNATIALFKSPTPFLPQNVFTRSFCSATFEKSDQSEYIVRPSRCRI